MKKMVKKMMFTAGVLFFVGFLVTSCNKYDKMKIVGSWEIDIKAAQNLAVDSCKETLTFDSGNSQKFKQSYMLRKEGRYTRWTREGNFERKHNKLTFYNQTQDDGSKVADVTYKYKIENSQLIFIVDDSEGYPNNEKIYTAKK